ncbi:hypothetical protein KOR42_51560 [Thalassoglobus neptunius]|uniref:Uncharacterized protein n=1 Tax=Thalassoglobus neptunius TaxID=1938619 RepID=A0A5C5VQE1_9PLAN|nr:hypothetical protein KOR42_51560 [Thalassoglobus neptunius]
MVITLFGWPTKCQSNKTGSRTAPPPFISDSKWELIKNLFPIRRARPKVGVRL